MAGACHPLTENAVKPSLAAPGATSMSRTVSVSGWQAPAIGAAARQVQAMARA
jgi:hypothetical protein